MNMEFEHLHVMVNHVPLLGLVFVCVPLAYALIANDRHMLLMSLGVIIALAVSARVTMWTGEEATERFEHGPVKQHIDEHGLKWIGEHEYRAERAAFTTYLLGVLAIGGYVALWKRPNWLRAIAGSMLVLCLLNFLLYAWCADAGGKVRHAEFRDPSQPAPLIEREHEH